MQRWRALGRRRRRRRIKNKTKKRSQMSPERQGDGLNDNWLAVNTHLHSHIFLAQHTELAGSHSCDIWRRSVKSLLSAGTRTALLSFCIYLRFPLIAFHCLAVAVHASERSTRFQVLRTAVDVVRASTRPSRLGTIQLSWYNFGSNLNHNHSSNASHN